MNKSVQSSKKIRLKILKFCASKKGTVSILPAKLDGYIVLKSKTACLNSIPIMAVDALKKQGMVVASKNSLQTTSAGKMHLRRALCQVDEFQQQHRLTGHRKVLVDNNLETLISNEGESPLTRLRYRPAKDGKSYIDDMEFQAGERLRTDFSKGQLTRQLSSNWSVTENEVSGSNGRNGIVDLSDTALAARKRTTAAFTAVGPEFSGVLMDICCFLKGLELVENERQWPPRSAKLMLKTGLSILARHYGFAKSDNKKSRNSSSLRHWGGDNFKPNMFPE